MNWSGNQKGEVHAATLEWGFRAYQPCELARLENRLQSFPSRTGGELLMAGSLAEFSAISLLASPATSLVERLSLRYVWG